MSNRIDDTQLTTEEIIENLRYVNFRKMTIFALLCLIPAAISLILYNKIPQEMPAVISIDGTVTKTMEKNIWFFISIPLLMTLTEISVNLLTGTSNRYKNNAHINLIYSLMPLISFMTEGIYILTAFKASLTLPVAISLLSLLFILLGNYLPKLPLKTSTHELFVSSDATNSWIRISAKIFFVTGFLLLPAIFMPRLLQFIFFITVTAAGTISPFPFILAVNKKYRKHKSM